MGFFHKLQMRVEQVDSLLCVGLDPHHKELSSSEPNAIYDYCMRLVTTTADIVAAYKPNIAFFEAFGPQGLETLKKVIAEIPKEIPVIIDAKRSDIASTADAYAHALFEVYWADAITLNPYLGYDSIEPFVKDENRAVFLLCKTSNPGSRDIQDIRIFEAENTKFHDQPRRLYERIAGLAQAWNQLDNLGLVVGATQPEALENVRRIATDLWILAPGVGAQGGDLSIAIRAGLREDGFGMIIPVSRAISRVDDPRKEALRIRDDINRNRSILDRGREKEKSKKKTLGGESAKIADDLLKAGCVKFGDFKLKSGLKSPIYIDLRLLVGFPDLLIKVSKQYILLLKDIKFHRLAALPYAALPIATSISTQANLPMIYARKEKKSYGTGSIVEGPYQEGEVVVVIDDLVTTGESKFESIQQLEEVGLQVKDIVVLIDRQSGASKILAERGYKLHALFKLSTLLDYWKEGGYVSTDQINRVRDFLGNVEE
jgi:uridine monophosphate synthetase